jgi:hypothetical protein
VPLASFAVTDEGWEPPGRVRRVLYDLAAFVLYLYLAVLPVSFGLGWLSRQGDGALLLSLVLGTIVFLGLGFAVFLWLAYEEDWWDDFREQNRAMVVFGLLHLVGLPAAWFWGRSLGG